MTLLMAVASVRRVILDGRTNHVDAQAYSIDTPQVNISAAQYDS